MWRDSEVLADVEAALAAVREASDGWLGVDVCAGRVAMHGLVATGAQRARAIRAVRRVIGVSSVAESIVVTSGSLARRLDEHLADDEVRLHAGFMCYDPGRAPELRLLLASHTRR